MKKSALLFLSIISTAMAMAQMDKSIDAAPGAGGITSPPYYRYSLHKRKNFSLLAGYNFGKIDYAELGLSVSGNKRKYSRETYTSFFVSGEVRTRGPLVLAPKIGCWVGNGLGAGANIIYYTDLNGNTTLRIRPEAGIAVEGMKLVYGYNIPITGSTFEGVSKHVVSFAFNVPLAKISEVKTEGNWNPAGRKKYLESRGDSIRDKDFTLLLLGVNGFTDVFGEVGIAIYTEADRNRKGASSIMAFFATEFKVTDQTIIAPKIGMHVHGRRKVNAGIGTSLIYYTGMRHGSLAVRPEFGLNLGMLRLVYGYNHILTNYAYPSVSRSNLSAIFGVKAGKGKMKKRIDRASKNF